MSLMDKIRKNSTIKESSILTKSKFFTTKDLIPTPVPALNIALSGSLNGGFSPGLTMWAGPSKHFKTAFSLLMAKSYMDKYPDSVLVFYDSEFGTPKSYFDSFQIDMDRVLHTPLTNIEQFKFDSVAQLEGVERGDKIIFVVDSVGNMASKKELEDAIAEKGTTDMSRAKQIKSCFRMITPYLNIKDIPMIVVNHIYMTQEMYSKPVVSGGTGPYYSADNIYIIGRQQTKDGNDLDGYNFIINVEKSRYVREKSKIPVTVKFDGGISKFSGLLEIALESGHVIKPKNGWYQKVDLETGEVDPKSYREKNTSTNDFWNSILKSTSFNEYVEKTYKISNGNIISEEDSDPIVDEELNDSDDISLTNDYEFSTGDMLFKRD
jgi:RecA/RadA recombinase